MKIRFEINEINNGWVVSFYNIEGQQTYYFNNSEDMMKILSNLMFKETDGYPAYKDSGRVRNG
jgi:hypothetical protein